MKKVKRYLRGSGRFFAFVFIASVIWLLFDMAALRLSINDANSQLLKERVIQERELFRQKSKKSEMIMKRFKSPVQAVDATQEAKGPLHADIIIDQVYRQGSRNHEQVMRDKNRMSLNQEGDNVPRADSLDPKKQEDILHNVAANKKAVDLDLNVDKLEKNDAEEVSDKDTEKKQQLHFQKDGHAVEPIAEKEQNAVDVKIGDKAKAKEETGGELEVVEKNNKAFDGDVRGKEVKLKYGQEHVRSFNKSDISVLKKPVIRQQVKESFKDNSTAANKTAVHQVLSLDVTLSPRDPNAVGQFGLAAQVASNEEDEVKKRWDEGHFNVYLSDQIPIDRGIPDVRPEGCAQKRVHDNLPSTSVIFCFVDEVWSTLLRSVHSVLNRSPPHLIEEIILVDDFSTREYLKEPLDKYMSQFPKVRILRLKERQGLIRARLAGAAVAKGKVLTFLDSHVECNVGWLEPLLERVCLDRKKVPCPVIDVISDKDMSYLMIDNFQRGVFKWPLVFGWSLMSPEYLKNNNITASDPFRCPVMAGGLFSIDKNYFFELGTYDRGLDVWGGENMEISFKIWMCGGEIEIIPCSRVGHIFRGQNPYKFPKDRQKTVERNLARVAEVWLDEYKDIFYGHGYHHMLDKNTFDVGDLTEQIELRKKLKCKSFKWYLENVFPDMKAPLVKAQGMLFNQGSGKCLTLQNSSLFMETCHQTEASQQFNYTWMMQIRQQDLCVVPQQQDNGFVLQPCNNSSPEQRWFHKATNSPMAEHLISEVTLHRVCLEAEPNSDSVHVKPCVPLNDRQKWQFTHYNI